MNEPYLVRRPHPPQSEQLRCKRVRKEIWRIVTLLGHHLVDDFAGLNDHLHHRRHCRVPSVVERAGEGFKGIHSDLEHRWTRCGEFPPERGLTWKVRPSKGTEGYWESRQIALRDTLRRTRYRGIAPLDVSFIQGPSGCYE